MIWVLKRDEHGYDESDGFVVRAASEHEARKIASVNAGYEGRSVWLDASKSSCEVVPPDGPSGLIFSGFRPG